MFEDIENLIEENTINLEQIAIMYKETEINLIFLNLLKDLLLKIEKEKNFSNKKENTITTNFIFSKNSYLSTKINIINYLAKKFNFNITHINKENEIIIYLTIPMQFLNNDINNDINNVIRILKL
ncbi:MAG: hypothetical protein E7172_02145 [Firmicutes bacterium]|nr:hypothetical protein [Bacillota bacterium]